MPRSHDDDTDDTHKWIIGIFIVGALLYSCDHMPTGGPVEHKCRTEVGYEKC